MIRHGFERTGEKQIFLAPKGAKLGEVGRARLSPDSPWFPEADRQLAEHTKQMKARNEILGVSEEWLLPEQLHRVRVVGEWTDYAIGEVEDTGLVGKLRVPQRGYGELHYNVRSGDLGIVEIKNVPKDHFDLDFFEKNPLTPEQKVALANLPVVDSRIQAAISLEENPEGVTVPTLRFTEIVDSVADRFLLAVLSKFPGELSLGSPRRHLF